VKIVDVSEFYSPTGGGVRNYVDRKFKAAAKHGHVLSVIAPGTENRVEPREGGKLIWVATPQLPFDENYRMFWGAAAVQQVIDGEAPDVVEGSSPWRGGWIAAGWQGKAVKMLFMHADPVAVYPQTLLSGILKPAAIDKLFGWYWAYLRRLNACFDGCIVAGAWLAERFAAHGLRNLEVVPFGVETKWFRPGLRDEALRVAMLEKCGLGPEAALLVNIGRHHPEKRVGTAIAAAAKAGQSRPVGLYVIGDGFIRGSIEAKAAREAHVHMAGWVGDRETLAGMLASADALLHCSSAETYGFVVAEALCCGTPVIVPDKGGAGDLAGEGYARTYPPGDAEGAAKAVLDLLAKDRAGLSRAALEAGKRIGDIEGHFDKLFAVYEEAVGRKRAGRLAGDDMIEVNHAEA
jgi:alpha-1,6-mannosyltransferase